jgi:hypothetical protein
MQKWKYLLLDARVVGKFSKRGKFKTVWEANSSKIGRDNRGWKLGKRPIVEYVNQLGEQGWELVSISSAGLEKVMFFNRPKE